jgi:hypothetical protein
MPLLVTPRTSRTAVKAVENTDGTTTVSGYLVVFDDPASPVKDFSGDYFTSDTYFGARGGDGADCLFHHGVPLKAEIAHLADAILPPLKVEKDDVGLFATVVLDMADKYQAKIAGLAAKGKLGWSSGSAPHVAKREPDGEITRWPIIEGSLTPQPCESRTVMKSILDFSEVTTKADGESLSAFVERVSRAFYSTRSQRASYGWVADVYADHVIAFVSGDGADVAYRIGYTDDGSETTFDDVTLWQKVERVVTYEPAAKAIADLRSDLSTSAAIRSVRDSLR